ncbi:CCPGW family putative bacteriocin [Chryseobacterium vietnamense]|uniref:CCPGW family putative bacteriocin n=1 Tax=Chryseobacterium vietnamense TaxID=866785 RepID=UPI004041E2A4
MKNSKKLSRGEMKTVQGAIKGCNPQIFCTSPQTQCCPGWVCAGIRQYCIAI